MSSITAPYSIEPASSSSSLLYSPFLWAVLFFGLAFIGINVFAYLHHGSQLFVDALNPILSKWLGFTIGLTSSVVDSTLQGGIAVASTAEQTMKTAQELTPQYTSSLSSTTYTTPEKYTSDKKDNAALALALQSTSPFDPYDNNDDNSEDDGEGEGNLKSGWCYIGQDKGFRTCAKIGTSDVCASKRVFSTQDKCVHPELRY